MGTSINGSSPVPPRPPYLRAPITSSIPPEIAEDKNLHRSVKAVAARILNDMSLQAPENQMSIEKWNVFVDDTYEELKGLFIDIVLGLQTGKTSWEEKKEEIQSIKSAIEALHTKQLSIEKPDSLKGRITAAKLSETLEKVGQAQDTLGLYTEYHLLAEKIDEKALRLTDLLTLLEVGEAEISFEEYRDLMEEVKSIVDFGTKVAAVKDGGIRKELFGRLHESMTVIRRIREDFIEEVRRIKDADFVEQSTRYLHATNDGERMTAWQEMRRIDAHYGRHLEHLQHVESALSGILTAQPRMSLFSSAINWLNELNPVHLYRPEQQTDPSQQKFYQDAKAILTDIDRDRSYLSTLKGKSAATVSSIHAKNPTLYSREEPLPTRSLEKQSPISAEGMRRAREIAKEHALRAEIAKGPDERYRVLLNHLFLGMQLLSGVQWYFQTLPQQAEQFKLRAEQLSAHTSYLKMNAENTQEQKAQLQQHLLIIEAVLHGYFSPTTEEFSTFQKEMPQLAAYIQEVCGHQQPPFAVAATEDWVQQQMMRYMQRFPPTKSMSIAESLQHQLEGARSWFKTFLTPDLGDNITLFRDHGQQPERITMQIQQQASLIDSALRWQGNQQENPFMRQLQEITPTAAAWVKQWAGQSVEADVIRHICDFYVRAATNSFIRFAHQSVDVHKQETHAYAVMRPGLDQPIGPVQVAPTAAVSLTKLFRETLSTSMTKLASWFSSTPQEELLVGNVPGFFFEAKEQGLANLKILYGEALALKQAAGERATGVIFDRIDQLHVTTPEAKTPLPEILDWLHAIDHCLLEIQQAYLDLPPTSPAASLPNPLQKELERFHAAVSTNFEGWFTSSPKERLDSAMKAHDVVAATEAIKDGANVNDYWNTPYLSDAVRRGYKPMVELLIAKGARVNDKTTALSWAPVHEAVDSGDLEIFTTLVRVGKADINSQTNLGYTPLHLAVNKGGRLPFVRYILGLLKDPQVATKPNLNIQCRGTRFTALHEAAKSGDYESAKALIEAGAGLEIQDSEGRTPLHVAVQHAPLTLVQALVNKGAGTAVLDSKQNSIAHHAAQRGDAELFAYVVGVQRYIDVNHQNSQGKTAGHLAVEHDNRQILQSFIDNKGNVNVRDHNGANILHLAAEKENPALLDIALKAGGNIKAKDKNGNTPLHRAMLAKHKATVDHLLANGADINSVNNQGMSIAHLALEQGNMAFLRRLAALNANLNQQDASGKTLLLKALEMNNSEAVSFLLDQGVDTTLTDKEGISPLHKAVLNNDVPTIQKIAKVKASLDTQMKDGKTAAHIAMENGNIAIVNLLLQHGANPNIPDNRGFTLLHIALISRQPLAVIQNLVNHGADVNIRDKEGLPPIVHAHHDLGGCKIIEYLLENGTNVHLFTSVHGMTPKLLLLSMAQSTSERACAAKLGEDKMTDEYLFRKLLGHAWEIKGETKLTDRSFSYEGVGAWGQPFFAEKMQESIERVSLGDPKIIPPALKDTIVSTFKSATNDLDAAWDRYQQNQPILIHTGFQGHAMNVLLVGDYLIICNRGALSSKPVEAYRIDREKLSKGSLQSMMNAKNLGDIGALAFYKLFIGYWANTRQDEVTAILSKFNTLLNYQTVGNCAWESMEAAMYTLFLLLQMQENKQEGNPVDAGVIEAAAHFDDWLKKTELAFLEEYLNAHETKEMGLPIDTQIVETIFSKAGMMLNERLEAFAQYSHIAQERLASMAIYNKTLKDLKERYVALKSARSNTIEGATQNAARAAMPS